MAETTPDDPAYWCEETDPLRRDGIYLELAQDARVQAALEGLEALAGTAANDAAQQAWYVLKAQRARLADVEAERDAALASLQRRNAVIEATGELLATPQPTPEAVARAALEWAASQAQTFVCDVHEPTGHRIYAAPFARFLESAAAKYQIAAIIAKAEGGE
jgi:cell division protein FtsB